MKSEVLNFLSHRREASTAPGVAPNPNGQFAATAEALGRSFVSHILQ
jgi:hypothetical protein